MYFIAVLLLLGTAVISLTGSATFRNASSKQLDLDDEFTNSILDDESESDGIPAFQKWPSTLEYPDCAQLFHGDRCDKNCEAAIEEYVDDGRVTFSDEDAANLDDVPRNCSDYYARGYFSDWPASDDEAQFPIAFANIVYKDFDLLERIFSVIYAPQNFYCYAVDAKASAYFKQRVAEWAKCFPNVVLPDTQLSVASSGVNVTAAHLSCLAALEPTNYKYVILLQNHDIPLRTNAELVRILKIFNGANDISTLKPTPSSINLDANWTFAHLNLFRNQSLNTVKINDTDLATRLYPTKSLVGVSLSRAMVDFVLNDLNVTGFVNQLEKVAYGMDENFISTLNSNDALGAPGGFTRACLLRGFLVASISRYAVWSNHNENCHSQNFRHGICVFGVEDLRYLARRNELFLNKMMPDFDYGAAMCWLDALYNRTHFGDNAKGANLRDEYYATLPNVRYQRRKATNDLFTFNCTHPYRDYYF